MKSICSLAPVLGVLLLGAIIVFTLIMNFTYRIENGRVFYQKVNSLTWKVEKTEMTEAHAPSFKRMMSTYAKDKDQVYLDGRVIRACDPATFKVLDYTWKFSRDAHYVYYRHTRISDDPENFEILEKGASRDSKHRYRYHEIVETFEDPA